jgi:hypothetical protein
MNNLKEHPKVKQSTEVPGPPLIAISSELRNTIVSVRIFNLIYLRWIGLKQTFLNLNQTMDLPSVLVFWSIGLTEATEAE